MSDSKKAQNSSEPVQLKTEFIARVSHEVRTPLHGIVGMTNLLMQTELDEEQQEYLAAIKDSADRLHSLLVDILDFTRIESGSPVFEEIPFSPAETVTSVADSFRQAAREKGIRLSVLVSDLVPRLLKGDPARLRQIVANLVDNAIKFTVVGEIRIVVTTGRETDGCTPFTVAVRDTGPGIEEERLDDIFRTFTQLDGSTTRAQGGTGLGLSMARRLVERLGGRLHVESRPGKGSEFRFTLRLAVVENGAERLPRVPLERLIGTRALLVDDNLTSRRIAARALSDAGLRVQPAMNAEGAREAIQVAESLGDPFTIAVIDAHAAGGHGFDLARDILQSEPPGSSGSTSVIVLAASGRRGDAALCRELGVSGYLTKPIRTMELLDAVRAVLAFDGKVYRELVTRHLLRESTNPVTAALAEPLGNAAIDRRQLLARMGGDDALMRELAGMFLKESPRRLKDVEEAIENGDTEAITQRAHKLKGALGSLAADAAYDAAAELERAGRDRILQELESAFVNLKSEVDLVQQDLQILLQSEPQR